ncbi:MAG: 4Fe-4S dicluster domain-containing protein [Gemmatimonadota bacterium]|jgi:molybdopterin-containing oxidoreductase family iron-sulfur binding subunit
MEKKSRREFLRESAAAALGLGAALPMVTSACSGAEAQGQVGAATGSQWGMIIDMEKAKDPAVREACTEACRREHNIPRIDDPKERIRWIWEEEYQHVFPDQVHDHMPEAVKTEPVIVLCNHCTNPPCVRVCPTQATWKRESDGIVMMDMHRCIGCRYCMAACPYGSRSFNWRDPRPFVDTDYEGNFLSEYPTRTRGVVEKCNFCAERIREGLDPACVEAANQVAEGAMIFGDVTDPNSEISRVLQSQATMSRRVSLGTGPNVFYLV